jgi:hypothetical protein
MAHNTTFNTVAPYSEALAKCLTIFQNRVLTTAGMVIKAGSSAIPKTGAGVLNFSIGGKVYSVAAATDMALTSVAASTVADGKSRVFFLFLDASSTLSIMASAAVATASIATVAVMPDYDMSTLVPFAAIKVSNASGSTFTPATTALDAANVTVTYVNLSAPLPGQAV